MATLLGMGARSLEKDDKGLTVVGVAEAAEKFVKRAASRSLAVSLPDKEMIHGYITREEVNKAICILRDESSESSSCDFDFG